MRRFVLLTAAAALVCAPVFAAPASVRVEGMVPVSSGYAMRAATVSFDDTELSSTSGAAALLTRIEEAAHAVCTSSRAVSVKAAYVARCQKNSVADAVAAIHTPLLTEVAAK